MGGDQVIHSQEPCDHCGKPFGPDALYYHQDGRIFCNPCLQAMKQKHEDDPVSIHTQPIGHKKRGGAWKVHGR